MWNPLVAGVSMERERKVLGGGEEFLLEPRPGSGGLWDLRPFHSLSHSIDVVGHWGAPRTARTGRRGCSPTLLELTF